MLVWCSLCQNVVLLDTVSYGEEMKTTGSQVRADGGGWSNTSDRKRFRSLFVAATVCGGTLSWGRTIPEDIIPRRWFWIKESNYSTHSILGGRIHCLRHVYKLTTRSELTIQYVAIDWHTRDITQHICAKLHMILTVVLISLPIGPWKKCH